MQHRDLSSSFSGTWIQDEDLILCPMQFDHLEEMAKWPKFEDKRLAWANFPAQTSELRKRWYSQQQKSHLQWIVVRDRKSGELVGRCSLTEPLSGNSVMFGIVIHPEKLGRGLGTRVTRTMIRYTFEVTDKEVIWLESRYDNEPAHATWKKVGFIKQGQHYRREVFGRYDRYIGYCFTKDMMEGCNIPQIDVNYLE